MVKSIGKPKIFYGYIIVAAAVIVQVITWGTYNSYGVFFNALLGSLSWPRAVLSGAPSVGQVVIGMAAIALGKLNDRFGPRVLMTVCGVLAGVGYFCMTFISDTWQLYLFYGLIVSLGVSGSDVILLSTTARWFNKRRGMMSGILKMGTGAGMMIMPLVVSSIIAARDWRFAFIVIGSVIVVFVVVASQFLRRTPSQMQQYPDGEEPGSLANVHLVERGLTLKEAAHTSRFWKLCLSYLAIFSCAQTMIVHLVTHVVDLGNSAGAAAAVISVVGGASIAGRFLMGVGGDRIGNRSALVLSVALLVVAMVWLLLVEALWAMFVFALIYGFAHGGFYTVMSTVTAEFFGTRHHGFILGVVIFFGSLGGAISPFMAGYIFDVSGSYQAAFIVLLGLAALAFLMMLSTRQVPKGYGYNV